MVIRRPRRRGRYAPLYFSYYLDPKIIEAGLQAEVVYVRSLAFSAASGLDGFIHDAHVHHLCRGVRGIRRTCEALVHTGLWIRDDERQGFHVRSWHKWNPSEDEISAGHAQAAGGRRGRGTTAKNTSPATANSGADRSHTSAEAEADTSTEATDRPHEGPGRSVAPPDLSDLRRMLEEGAARRKIQRGRS